MRGRLIQSEKDKSGAVAVLVEEDAVLIKLLKARGGSERSVHTGWHRNPGRTTSTSVSLHFIAFFYELKKKMFRVRGNPNRWHMAGDPLT